MPNIHLFFAYFHIVYALFLKFASAISAFENCERDKPWAYKWDNMVFKTHYVYSLKPITSVYTSYACWEAFSQLHNIDTLNYMVANVTPTPNLSFHLIQASNKKKKKEHMLHFSWYQLRWGCAQDGALSYFIWWP